MDSTPSGRRSAVTAITEIGVDINLGPHSTVGLTYGGQFASGALDQSVRGEFALRF